jgi:hypothetical protein
MYVGTRGGDQFPRVLLRHSGVAPPYSVHNQKLAGGDSLAARVQRITPSI